MLKILVFIFYICILVINLSCTSLDYKSTQTIEPRVKNNRYISTQTFVRVDLPSIMASETIIISEYGLGLESKRVIVNFGPALPDRAVFTVQVADLDLYDEVTHMGNADIFSSGSNKSIRDDYSDYFFNQLFRSLKEYKFKKIAHSHFTHRGKDVSYLVYKDYSDNKTVDKKYIPPEIYYIFYLTEMNNKGVLVWLQIPIVSNELDGRSEEKFINRKWEVQNNFFNSLVIANKTFIVDSDNDGE